MSAPQTTPLNGTANLHAPPPLQPWAEAPFGRRLRQALATFEAFVAQAASRHAPVADSAQSLLRLLEAELWGLPVADRGVGAGRHRFGLSLAFEAILRDPDRWTLLHQPVPSELPGPPSLFLVGDTEERPVSLVRWVRSLRHVIWVAQDAPSLDRATRDLDPAEADGLLLAQLLGPATLAPATPPTAHRLARDLLANAEQGVRLLGLELMTQTGAVAAGAPPGPIAGDPPPSAREEAPTSASLRPRRARR